MENRDVPVLLVTANVGSIFEDPTCMLKIWCKEFLELISSSNPKFIALHCQEVGGKNYENSMKHVADFINLLISSDELQSFKKIRIFLDEDYSSAENFTALGNFYFIHDTIKDVKIWNFKASRFEEVNDKEVFNGNIELVVTKEKAKFPQNYFPECKWSRKGFLRTRWSLNSSVFDLINIHLFHDASNFVAMESFPSIYCKNRRKALEYVLHRFHNDSQGAVPYFLFGDFNFRPDTKTVIQNLTEGLTAISIQTNRSSDHTKMEYNDDNNELILTLGKKEFNHMDHENMFLKNSDVWLKEHDKELAAFEDRLLEFPVTFPPSYPYEENVELPTNYMKTRCPAWCDRILLSHTAKDLIVDTDKVEYNLLGQTTCMGDHKPVYLSAIFKGDTGIVKCCDHKPLECLPANCRCCQTYPSVIITDVDFGYETAYTNPVVDSKLLHEPLTREMLSHDPYTPESTDSPNSEKVIEDDSTPQSVKPEVLKSRLESILHFGESQVLPKVGKMQRSASQGVNQPLIKSSFRNRAMSDIPKDSPKLKLSLSAAQSSLRLQSHHSSSDEDWFEYRNTDEGTKEVFEDDKSNCLGDNLNKKEKHESLKVEGKPINVDIKLDKIETKHLHKGKDTLLEASDKLVESGCTRSEKMEITRLEVKSTHLEELDNRQCKRAFPEKQQSTDVKTFLRQENTFLESSETFPLHPRKTLLLEPRKTETSQPSTKKLLEVNKANFLEPSQTKFLEPSKTNLLEPSKTKVLEPSKAKLLDPSETNLLDSSKTKLLDGTKIKLLESSKTASEETNFLVQTSTNNLYKPLKNCTSRVNNQNEDIHAQELTLLKTLKPTENEQTDNLNLSNLNSNLDKMDLEESECIIEEMQLTKDKTNSNINDVADLANEGNCAYKRKRFDQDEIKSGKQKKDKNENTKEDTNSNEYKTCASLQNKTTLIGACCRLL